MATADDIPPIPTPTPEQSAPAVPPIESAPVAPAAPAAPAPPVEPAPPAEGYAPAAPPAYAQPVYAQPTYAPPAYAYPTNVPAGPYVSGAPRGLSIASLICGIGGVFFSLFLLGFLPSLAAVITGHMAQRRQKDARPLWLAGLITGYIGIGFSVISFIVIVILIVVSAVNGVNSTSDYGYYNT